MVPAIRLKAKTEIFVSPFQSQQEVTRGHRVLLEHSWNCIHQWATFDFTDLYAKQLYMYIYNDMQSWTFLMSVEDRTFRLMNRPTTSIRPDYFIIWKSFIKGKYFKVSATLKNAIFPYLRFQRFQIDMLEIFLLKKKSEENIISVQRYRG